MPALMKAVFLIIGLALVAAALWLRWMRSNAAAWPSVEGEITASALDPDPHDAGSVVRIEYRYAVAGRAYASNRISFGVHSDARPEKEARVAAYPAGRKLAVYYNPGNPASAVLEREASNGWLLGVGIGAVFAAVGLFA